MSAADTTISCGSTEMRIIRLKIIVFFQSNAVVINIIFMRKQSIFRRIFFEFETFTVPLKSALEE